MLHSSPQGNSTHSFWGFFLEYLGHNMHIMKNVSTCCYYSQFAQHPHLTLYHNIYLTYAGEPLHLTKAHKVKALSFHHHISPSSSHVGFIKNMVVGASKKAVVLHLQLGTDSAWGPGQQHGEGAAGMGKMQEWQCTVTAYFIKAELVLFWRWRGIKWPERGRKRVISETLSTLHTVFTPTSKRGRSEMDRWTAVILWILGHIPTIISAIKRRISGGLEGKDPAEHTDWIKAITS